MTDQHPENLDINHTHYCIAKADTGASNHYWREIDDNILQQVVNQPGPSVQLPNSEIIHSTARGEIPLPPEFSKTAKETMILPKLTSSNLISLGQLCDDNCEILLNKNEMHAIKGNKVILKGYRNKTDGLWDIPIKKSAITTQCCPSPPIHPSMYSSTNTEPKTKPKRVTFTPATHEHVACHLTHLSTLASYNQWNNELDSQQAWNTKYKANVILRKKQTHAELAKYLHAACYSPVTSTFTKAIDKGHFKTWPGLTSNLINKHLPVSIATVKGHLVQERQHLQTSRPKCLHPIDILTEKTEKMSINMAKTTLDPMNTSLNNEDIDDDFFPKSPATNTKTNSVAYLLVNTDEVTTGYMDLTGRFPRRSSQGNEYILVGYHHDGNTILASAIKDRTANSIVKAWQNMHDKFKQSGVPPSTYILDNEKSKELEKSFEKEKVKYQLSPPNCHRTNKAERAIQTFKHHLKAGLASTDPNFPLSEWDRLLEQAIITLNLLRSSRTNPALSAYSYIFGEFNFSATPLSPPGTKVISHVKPEVRNSWDLNGQSGWYVGPAMSHYRCVRIYFPATKSERICDTVRFIPHDIPFPKITTDDYLKQAADDIISILTRPPSSTTPSLSAGDPVRNALLELATQLNRIESISTPDAVSPRVGDSYPTTTSSPRVKACTEGKHHALEDKSSPPLQLHDSNSALEYTRRVPKNLRFRNQRPHRYPLRSLQKDTPLDQCAHIFNALGKRQSIDALLKGDDRTTWLNSLSNEWGRLAQGNKRGVIGTNTIRFIYRNAVPKDQDVTYATFVCDHKPLKEETHRVRITVGGDRLACPDDTGSPTANIVETKILANSTISDAHLGARMCSVDLQNFYLATPMVRKEYMRVQLKHLPPDIIAQYNLLDKATSDGWVYIAIEKGMYGLKSAAILAYNNLKKNLEPYGYYPIEGTVGMWRHKTRKTRFCVCVDDFGIKYFNKNDIDHLLDALNNSYNYTIDWECNNYCGLSFDWNYNEGWVDISMPTYITKALKRLQYKPHTRP